MLSFRFRPVAGRLAQVCKLPLTLSASQNPLVYQAPHLGLRGLPRSALPVDWQRFPKLTSLSPPSSLRPHGLLGSDVTSCDSPFGFTCVASRLAEVCKLPLTLSVSQNPPGRRSPAQVAHAPTLGLLRAGYGLRTGDGFGQADAWLPPPSSSQPHGSASSHGRLTTCLFFTDARSLGGLLRSASYP